MTQTQLKFPGFPLAALAVPVLAVLVYVLGGLPAGRAGSPQAHAKASAQRGPSPMPPPMPSVAPLFLEGSGFMSTVVLVNPAAAEADVKVVLRQQDGAAARSEELKMQPRSRVELPLAQISGPTVTPPEEGSVLLTPENMEGNVVAAQLEINFTLAGTPSVVDEEFLMPTAQSSPTLRGVADASESPLLAITSLSAKPRQ